MQTSPKLRMTTQRQVILEELRKLKSHPTAGELCQIVRQRLPRISLGTVYRNLEILSRSGVVLKLDVAGLEMRFDGTVDNHYHVRCLDCGRSFQGWSGSVRIHSPAFSESDAVRRPDRCPLMLFRLMADPHR